MGYAALGGDKIAAGSLLIPGDHSTMGTSGRRCGELLRELICDLGPFDVVAFASPFVGVVRRFNPKTGKSEPVPVRPESLRPLMGFTTIIEVVAAELKLRCVECSESEARGAFLEVVPRKSKNIESAVIQACRDRGWPCRDGHTGAALCVGSFVLSKLEPSTAHEVTPLFIHEHGKPKRAKSTKVARPRKAASRAAVA